MVLRSAEQQLNKLPFDLLKVGRQLTFALHQLFPKLNYPVLYELDRTYLDAVAESYEEHDGDQLTERETKEFVLMHCFSIVPKLIKTPVDLLKVLLSLHARKIRLPDFLNDFLLESLTKEPAFVTWPLHEILPSRESFCGSCKTNGRSTLALSAAVPGRVECMRQTNRRVDTVGGFG